MVNDTAGLQETDNGGKVELLTFVVGGQNFCVDIMSVREIRSASNATPLPKSREYVLGVINLRGTVLPIMDLSIRLGIEREKDNNRNVIIVVAHGDRTIGLNVDAVSDILSVGETDIQAPPDTRGKDSDNFVSALLIHQDQMIRVLSLESIFPESGAEAA